MRSVPPMVLATALAAALAAPGLLGAAPLTILFTHDLHSSLAPRPETGPDGATRLVGGYARLAAEVEAARSRAGGAALLLDAGDFLMGTPFHTVCRETSAELRVMGAVGYDATTLGNHEFDFRPAGLAAVLESAKAAGAPLPAILSANLVFPAGTAADAGTKALEAAWAAYGGAAWTVIERGGVKVGIFGLLGREAEQDAPWAPPLSFADGARTARKAVSALRAAGAQVVVCLSHTGTWPDRRAGDELLAAAAPGIDIIVSGHTHRALARPIVVGSTLIVSSGAQGRAVGELVIDTARKGEASLVSYGLTMLDEGLPEDLRIAAIVASFGGAADRDYFSRYGARGADRLAELGWPMSLRASADGRPGEEGLGNMSADAFRKALRAADPAAGADALVGLQALGIIRDILYPGPVTVADAFTVLSLGLGEDGRPGYPLVSAWLYGRELLDVLEVDGTVSSINSDATLMLSGLRYETNPRRLFLDRVLPSSVRVEEADGSWKPLERGRLYRVVLDLYAAKMVGYVGTVTKGLLSIVPRDAKGLPLARIEDGIVDADPAQAGVQELKSWVAFASFLRSLPVAGGKIAPEVPAAYRDGGGRALRSPSWAPAALLGGARWTTLVALGLVLFLLIAALGLARAVARALARRRAGS